MRIAYAIAIILLVIGGLAWGIVGLFDVNILEMFGIRSPVTIAIYVLIGLAAILVAIGGRRYLRAGEHESRPEGAQPPEGGTPVTGRKTERTKTAGTPARPMALNCTMASAWSLSDSP